MKKLKRIMMLQNLSFSPAEPITKITGINRSLISIALENEENEAQEMHPLKKYVKSGSFHAS